MFERLGYNSFVFDHRRHGDSGEKQQVMAIMKNLISLQSSKR